MDIEAVIHIKVANLVSGSSDGLREGKERQGQVHEAILICLQLLVSLDNFDELQAHQAHHCSCGRGNGRNDLASYQFALDWMVMKERKGHYLSYSEGTFWERSEHLQRCIWSLKKLFLFKGQCQV